MSDKIFSLKEGESYVFEIYNLVRLPGENNEAYILIGPDSKKYLLPSKHYEHYNLSIGQKVNCKVDKINCSGQIFLEPDHPQYKAGRIYSFILNRLTSSKDALGVEINTAWVKDLNDREWPCIIHNPESLNPIGTNISCRLNRIKKSELFLSYPDNNEEIEHIQVGDNLLFKIIDETIHEGRELFVLEDPEGGQHLLIKDDYLNFGLIKGKEFVGKVEGQWPNGKLKIEPINPYYKLGEIYPFDFIRIERSGSEFEGQGGVLWLKDYYGQETRVKAHPWQSKDLSYHPNKIDCRVVRFKKGKLQLENTEIDTNHK